MANIVTGLVATGNSQGTALEVSFRFNHVGTTASSTGVILNEGIPNEIFVRNAGANALNVYPPIGYSIDGGTVNAAFSLAAGTTGRFLRHTDGNFWRVN